MSGAGSSRRDALRAATLAAGALTFGGLVRPLAATAQSTTEIEDLRDFLAVAVAREQISALAYTTAADANGTSAAMRSVLERFRDQQQAHVNALASALDLLGYDGPEAPDDPEDSGVFDEVDGIDEEDATELTDLLGQLADPRNSEEFLELLIEIEQGLISFYVEGAPALDSEDMRMTCAEIAANEAQHLVVLRELTGASPAELLTIEIERARDSQE
jgi:rubrerythrin